MFKKHLGKLQIILLVVGILTSDAISREKRVFTISMFIDRCFFLNINYFCTLILSMESSI